LNKKKLKEALAASNQVEEELKRKEDERVKKEEEARQAKLEEVNFIKC
jgi:hypothetical protein